MENKQRRVVILTGVSRGIGRKMAEILLKDHNEGFHYIFTVRSELESIKSELSQINPSASFELKLLDLESETSINDFISWFESLNTQLDVLFSNAAINDPLENKNGARKNKVAAQKVFNVSFIQTVELFERLHKYMSDDSKIILMSSNFGKLQFQPSHGQELLSDVNLTKEQLYQFVQEYVNDFEDQTKQLNFLFSPYRTSKAFINAYVRFPAQKIIKPQQSIFAVDPGWVQTKMGGKDAPLSTDEACPYLTKIIVEYPFGRHPLNGKMSYQNAETDFI